MLQLEINSIV